jgi:hypothetical protein
MHLPRWIGESSVVSWRRNDGSHPQAVNRALALVGDLLVVCGSMLTRANNLSWSRWNILVALLVLSLPFIRQQQHKFQHNVKSGPTHIV